MPHQKNAIKPFLKLIKHGIILGNLVPVIAGFFLAISPNLSSSAGILFYTLLGTSLVIASATITNNIIDRDIDKMMQRTQSRPLVNGDISVSSAVILAILSAVVGFFLLYCKVNIFAGNLALIGFIDYVLMYSLIFKRQSTFSILVGSISGAVPPLIGYVAVTNTFSWNLLSLFLIFSSWQIAHSYAIALYRKKDYEAARIPMAPLFLSTAVTQRKIAYYVGIMLIATLFLIMNSFFFLAIKVFVILLLLYWLISVLRPIVVHEALWGKKQFFNSLLIIMGLCMAIIVDHTLIFYFL